MWVQIQHAQQHSWADHEKLGAVIGGDKPEGLIIRAAGEVDGRWKAVSIWESQEAFDRFLAERVLPAAREVFGEATVEAGPPPTEWFEVKHVMRG